MTDDDLQISESLSLPMREITVRFSRSGGPGGQHVNKTETKVHLFFDISGSPTLSDSQKRRIERRLKNRMDEHGVLRLSCAESRSQKANRETALERLAELLAEALVVPKVRKKTRPTRASVERRIQNKKHRGNVKKDRGQRWEG